MFCDGSPGPGRGCRGTARGTSAGRIRVHCVRSGQIPETLVQAERSVRPSSGLLIRGFGVRVPGGAPAKTRLVDLRPWNGSLVPRNDAHEACQLRHSITQSDWLTRMWGVRSAPPHHGLRQLCGCVWFAGLQRGTWLPSATTPGHIPAIRSAFSSLRAGPGRGGRVRCGVGERWRAPEETGTG